MGFFQKLWELRPLVGKNRHYISILSELLDKKLIKEIKRQVNLGNVSFSYSKLGISKNIGEDESFPILNHKKPGEEISALISDVNKKIEIGYIKRLFPKFEAEKVIPKYVGFKIYGLNKIKRALSVLLFAKQDPFHVLLLGDPGTGKTAFLQTTEKIYPKTSFGLGSGTTGAGLSVTISGKKVSKGLLPLADEGLCLIDELNLMKKEDYAALYSAMEKGFISYDKNGKHIKFDARIRLLATANPIGGKFRGTSLDAIARQLPFEPALLSRFTMIFLVRKPNKNEFVKIAEEIVKDDKKQSNVADINFIREFIKEAENIEVSFPRKFKGEVSKFASKLKENEDKLFFDVSPRVIHGLINISKAFSRMELRDSVTEDDLMKAKHIILDSLNNRLD